LAATGGLLYSPTAPVFFMTAWETNLLVAEALARSGDDMEAEAAYDAGVTESFEYLGAGDPTSYLAGAGAYVAGAGAIKSIALQKWVCMNSSQNLESWIETRRFDGPDAIFTSSGGLFIEPTRNTLGAGNWPSIFFYPESEQSLNQNAPSQHSLTDKVFWDK
jgi:Starch-binding associating with outer membrane